MRAPMLLSKDECALCKRIAPNSYLRRCFRCGRLYCFDCTTYEQEGYIICLNCARRAVSPTRFGTKYSSLSRYLLRRGMFTNRVVLRFADVEGIIGNTLPFAALREPDWWRNTRSTAHGRAWTDVGWTVENTDMSKRTVSFVRVSEPKEAKRRTKIKENRKTEFFKRPLTFPRPKKPMLPSKTRIAKVQARLRNIERQTTGSRMLTKLPSRSAYEKRLFKPEAKPSKTSD